MEEQSGIRAEIETVAVSTRMRLARNVAGYPFPNKLKDENAAWDIVDLVDAALKSTERYTFYRMNAVTDSDAAYLKERNLISQTLIDNRRISAALISKDASISVMIHEEDHLREQYFMAGFDLSKAYERISGIDDIISGHM